MLTYFTRTVYKDGSVPKLLRQLLDNTWVFWALLALPMVWVIYKRYVFNVPGGHLFYWTGVFGVWFLLASLAITPLKHIFRTAGWVRWLQRRRRYIGLAAFAYSAIHTLYWLQQEKLLQILKGFLEPVILIGWIGFFIFTAMAVTSNDRSVRNMGPGWKRLQRWVYLAAPLTVWHWFMAEAYRFETVFIYGGLLSLILGLRVLLRRPKMQVR